MVQRTITPQSTTPEWPLVERRGKPRIACSYPALVRGHQDGGGKYEARAVLANMSASGMYLQTQRCVEPGENLFVMVRLSTGPLDTQGRPRLAVSGSVVRVEPKPDGTYGVAIELHQHRFL
jgi:hypothetical protein